MKKLQIVFVLFCISVQIIGQNTDQLDFEILNKSVKWHLKFKDDCTENWQKHWFLDGLKATVKNTDKGMYFSAGTEEGNDEDHAVLWTKLSFKGNLKIEYSYTRTDTTTNWVNILYIQATGVKPFATNIYKWKDERVIPFMKTYFNHMKALHISYAAFDANNSDGNNDYVRARRYPVIQGEDFDTTTEIPPASFKTGLFKSGETYKITAIKTSEKLYFKVEGKEVSKLFTWKLSESQRVYEGRIGLRHMYTRAALYKNIKVYSAK